MADWLRPVFARTKSSVQVASTSNSTDKPINFSDDGNEDDLHIAGRLRPTSRVSSYIGLRSNTPPLITSEHFPNLRRPQNVYHKPNCDHMAETLKVIMMTRNLMDAVPIEYNSHILHLLEAYQDGQEQLVKKTLIIKEVKEAHTRDIHEFESLTEEWESREKDYKAEVKRLEVLLSKTEGGMETVTMARTKSRIHGSKKFSESLGRDFGTIKERHATRNQKDQEAERRHEAEIRVQVADQETTHFHKDLSTLRNCSPILQVDEGSERSLSPFIGHILHSQPSQSSLQTPGPPDQEAQIRSPNPSKCFYSHIIRPQRSRQSLQTPEPSQASDVRSPHLSWQPQKLISSQLEELQRQRFFEKHESVFDSSTSESSSEGFQSEVYGMNNCTGRAIASNEEEPLPVIPSSQKVPRLTSGHSTNNLSTREIRAKSSLRERASKQMSFSFRPGDDNYILSPVIGGHSKNRELLEEHIHHLGDGHSYKQALQHQRPKSISSPDPPSRKLNNFQRSSDDQKLLSRDDSSSSIITAVRHNSGRSSMSIQDSARKARPVLNRHTGSGSGSGSNEAIAAAAWAFTGGKNGLPTHLRPETGSRSGWKRDMNVRDDALVRRSDGDGRDKQVWRPYSRTGSVPSSDEGIKKDKKAVTE